ncbi:acyltransferase family protein [uncultured Oscillibacter sp.]|uniref:acyltransferase family protein n=1 Tax=uncultured Oscillibacter sp. TaxID=876091 RepID=UPI002670A790|nr:acyltransferase family protein [uncultured Oscillibacter sp.]
MADGRRGAALDLFRLAAVVLVVANHTSPLVSVSPLRDFWFTRVLARVAVPFFLMVSGYFLAKDQWRRTGVFLKKTCLLYGAAVLLYLPLNWYNGGYGPAEWVKKLLLDGTFYHLWYFPGVILGVLVARGLLRLGPRTALTAAGLLYLVGLGGDSYYGLTCQLPALEALYGEIFQIFAYTRNGLFFTPLFLLLGAAGVRWSVRTSAAGLCAAFAAMTAEGLWLHGLQVQRHDSMYMLLPLVMVCLFSLLLGLNRGERRSCRKLSSLIYVLHPWCIVLVRGGAEVLGLEGPLVENSMGHFLAVLASSAAASWALWLAWSRRPLKRSNKG